MNDANSLSPQVTGSAFLALESSQVNVISGVDPEDMPTINRLLKVWRDKYPRNLLRSRYVDVHYSFKDFGISIPDRIKAKVEPMVGWPAKAVRSLADLSVFDGFELPDDSDPHGIRELADSNALDVAVPEAISSAYTHSCSFLTVYRDVDSGMMTIMPRSADWSAAIWDRRRHRIESALTITDDDEYGRITGFTVWLADRVYVCSSDNGIWSADRVDTNFGRPTVTPLCYDAQLNRPFGRSRVSRQLMSLTDIAFRTIVRMEASAEFYSVPKLWFLGADRDAFSSDTWSSLISAINAISKDEDGDKPEVHQISQASMQPHSDMLKTIAMMVSSETNIPVSDLGITQDNPSSAEAMAEAERKLSREADRQNVRFGRAIKDAVGMAVCLREGTDVVPDDLSGVRTVWKPTRESSDASRADSFAKIASVAPEFSRTEVGWRYAGFGQSDVEAIMATIRRAEATSTLDRLLAAGGSGDGSGSGGQAGEGSGSGGADGAAGDAEPVQDASGAVGGDAARPAA